MYGIGTVARLAQVSVRTLRHYDDLGSLRPARVDPLTGYRYYTPDQVVRLHRILVLRDLGVPLSQVGQLIDDDVTVEQLRGILRLRQAEARARLTAQTEQLRRVELRLAQLEEGSMADYEVTRSARSTSGSNGLATRKRRRSRGSSTSTATAPAIRG